MLGMNVYAINDTSAFHCGSWAVCEYLRRVISEKDHYCRFETSKTDIEFVALRGNTPKIDGLVAWSGIGLPVAREAGEIVSLLLRSRIFSSACRDLFDWMQDQLAWKFPF